MQRKFLVVGVIKAEKTGKFYAKGYFWNDDKQIWSESKNKDGWGASLVEISSAQYTELKSTLSEGRIVDSSIAGYTANDMPIRMLEF